MPKGWTPDLGPGVFGSLWRGFGVEQESSPGWNSAKDVSPQCHLPAECPGKSDNLTETQHLHL